MLLVISIWSCEWKIKKLLISFVLLIRFAYAKLFHLPFHYFRCCPADYCISLKDDFSFTIENHCFRTLRPRRCLFVDFGRLYVDSWLDWNFDGTVRWLISAFKYLEWFPLSKCESNSFVFGFRFQWKAWHWFSFVLCS